LKLAVYLCGFSLLFVAPFVLFSVEKALFVFFVVHVTSGVYLANCFAPNHKGMPWVESRVPISFLEQQVITARNVSGGRLTDFLLGGLNHQGRAPSLPGHAAKQAADAASVRASRLRRARDRLHGREPGRDERVLLRELAAVAAAARAAPAFLSRPWSTKG
jgi:hypothetical protein